MKGYANKRSDRDIAVCFSESANKGGGWRTFELEAELSRSVGETVQVTILNRPLSPILDFEIVKNGLLLLDGLNMNHIDIHTFLGRSNGLSPDLIQ